MSNKVERRLLGNLGVETRDDGGKRLVGYAAVFNSLSADLGGFREQIKPGAFQRSIEDDADVRSLWNHDDSQVLGRTTAGTLTLQEDERGLRVDIDPPDTQTARDAIVSIERGDVSQMSFAFRVRPGGQQFGQNDDGETIRTLTDVELFEVSPVTFPAYEDTVIDTRALQEYRGGDSFNWQDGKFTLPTSKAHERIKNVHRMIAEKEHRGDDWVEFRDIQDVDDTVQILMYDGIGMFGTDSKRFVQKLDEYAGRNLHIRLNSPGGDVFEGAAIYNALCRHNGFVTVDVEGMAASMASVIAMAADQVRVNQTGFMMIHNASSCVLGDVKAMRHEANLLEKINNTIARAYSLRAGSEQSDFINMMNVETWFDADEAKAAGIADEVLNAASATVRGDPKMGRMHDLSQFRNVPEKLKEQRRIGLRQRRIEKKRSITDAVAR